MSTMNFRYYSWKIACAIITSAAIFHKPLTNEIIERMQEKDAASNKSRTTTSGSWWPFYGKKVRLFSARRSIHHELIHLI